MREEKKKNKESVLFWRGTILQQWKKKGKLRINKKEAHDHSYWHMHKFKIIAQITTCELRIEQGLTDPFSAQSEGDWGKEESIQDGAGRQQRGNASPAPLPLPLVQSFCLGPRCGNITRLKRPHSLPRQTARPIDVWPLGFLGSISTICFAVADSTVLDWDVMCCEWIINAEFSGLRINE